MKLRPLSAPLPAAVLVLFSAILLCCPQSPTPDPGTSGTVEPPKSTVLRLPPPVRPVPVEGTGRNDAPGNPIVRSGAPLSLTSSDGTGLRVVSLQARAVVEDPLAFTELRLVFQNPQPRQIEGQFAITLPQGATISRFAMRQGDVWQEGEVVELQAARQAYEDFLHRRQDPALLEKQAGNEFRARVFPIPPSGTKELIVSYSQELPRKSDPYRIFLRGLPQLGSLDIRVLLGKTEVRAGGSSLGGTTVSHEALEVKKTDFLPDTDFEVAVPAAPDRLGLRHDNLVVARLLPVADQQPEPIESLIVLLDTSASRALGFAAQLDRLQKTLAALQAPQKTRLRLLAFDQDIEEIYAGPMEGLGQKQLAHLLDRRALGASDLGKALRFLVSRQGDPYARVLLVSDGIVTAGKTEGNELQKEVVGLLGAGVKRLDAIASGGIRDEALLRKLATAGLPKNGVVLDGDLPVDELARRLQRATFSGVKVTVPGSQWSWPAQLDGLQPGDEVLVYADLPRTQPFEVVLEGARADRQAFTLAQVDRPLLERAWVNARIQKLMYQRDTLAGGDQDLREALRHQIVDISTKFRVLSDFTAMLVLETEADYARFHIDRRALTDVLTVGQSGIEVVNRSQPATPALVNRTILSTTPQAQPAGAPAKPAQKTVMANQGALVEKKSRPLSIDGDGVVDLPKRGADKGKNDEGGALQGNPLAAKDDALGGLPGRRGGGAPAGAVAAPRPMPTPAVAALPAAEPEMQKAEANPPAPREERPMALVADPSPADRERRQRQMPAEPPRRMALSHRSAGPRADSPGLIDQLLGGGDSSSNWKQSLVDPYQGKLAQVMNLLKRGKRDDALRAALAWRDEDPGDVLALIGLGEALEAMGQKKAAARAYGSIIDLFPGRADLRRFAGERLERLLADGLELAVDTYRQARTQRPDHPASHRLLAYALLRAGQPEEAFEVIAEGAKRSYPEGRFAGVDRILHEDVGLIGMAWARKQPDRQGDIASRISAAAGIPPNGPSVRFILNWETDANDVDFHISDGRGGHAYYGQKALPSGGELYADVTTGYGPECFTIEGKPGAYPYKLQAHYYSRGPMGYGMGKLEIIEHDGRGNLRFVERPFVIMADNAFVDLGTVPGPLPQ